MDSVNSRLRFVVIDRFASKPQLPFPNVVLRIDNWDDFHLQTLFDVTLRTGPADELSLGSVKILQHGQEVGRPRLPSSFDRLDTDFCSLGQDIEYYEKLMGQPDKLRQTYLYALRDAAADPEIEQEFIEERGWKESLLRFGEAVNALEAGRQLVHGTALKTDQLSFRFDWWREGALTEVPFRFDDTQALPGRCCVLIGYNGAGKTTLLADLALTASSGRKPHPENVQHSTIRGDATTFGAVVAVSYSAFDTFGTPESIRGGTDPDTNKPKSGSRTAIFGYVYCGLRRRTDKGDRHANDPERNEFELKSIVEIELEFAEALRTAGRRREGGFLVSAFEALSREPSFGLVGIDIATLGKGLDSAGAIEVFHKLSTGHKIVLNIVAQLAAHLRTRSLVLIDEPETHLHPPLVAALLGAIQVLLKAHSSFAVIATHSPVVVQEIPAKYVSILERDDTGVSVRGPEIETFAENIGAITRHVFSLDSSATDYQGILASLSERHTVDEINDMFNEGLSVQGRALVASYRKLP
ncbi:AAA family ATPase [Mycobacterium sp. ITM-2016-00318]|uniref:AAA family ATPase n=1 Tax=Mycobacterium sp. ITM-2016-00318 TaxID=2099693 RepID=UPI001157E0A5|nr:AAA family ATPase [Mycobacterium sp. ITM-2016-00318]WNG95006.1 AAA family ATPase [Mycobacterium sp. ITM-2016-00318]